MIGERLGPWIIDAEIGHGAMGNVWKARRDGSDEIAAIKVLEPELARQEMFVERFRREIEALEQLQHPNIVRFLSSGEENGRLFYAMEYVDGKDCQQLLGRRGRFPWSEVLEIAEQTTAALKHAHDHGVIHRDLKPANILIADGGLGIAESDSKTAEADDTRVDGESPMRNPHSAIVKLTDFGVAKLFSRPNLTSAGSFVGTAAYLSPEQAVGKPATKRSDFYSLGGVLYCLLSGKPPFTGENTVELLQKHCHAQPERLQQLLPNLPHDIDAFVMRLLEKDPAKRPADGFVILRTIEKIRAKIARRTMLDTDVADEDLPTVEQAGLGTKSTGRGPATVMADLMRRELHDQNRGGAIARFFNHPITLLAMLAACIALIAYGFLRKKPSADELFAGAQPLMASEKPTDWERAWNEYLEPLNTRFPDNPHKLEAIQFRRQTQDWREQERALSAERPASEAERFYRLGLTHAVNGDFDSAKRIWQDLVQAFGGESDRRWVELAERGLKRLSTAASYSPSESIQASLARARSLFDAGKAAEAQAIWKALEDLYRGDPKMREIIQREKK